MKRSPTVRENGEQVKFDIEYRNTGIPILLRPLCWNGFLLEIVIVKLQQIMDFKGAPCIILRSKEQENLKHKPFLAWISAASSSR